MQCQIKSCKQAKLISRLGKGIVLQTKEASVSKKWEIFYGMRPTVAVTFHELINAAYCHYRKVDKYK